MPQQLLSQFAAACGGGSFLGFPHWYEFLNGVTANGVCSPEIKSLTDIWLIAAAIIDILLRVAAIIAFAFVLYGGFEYITSQGESSKTAQARDTIVNALVGLAVCVIASALVGFIAGRIT